MFQCLFCLLGWVPATYGSSLSVTSCEHENLRVCVASTWEATSPSTTSEIHSMLRYVLTTKNEMGQRLGWGDGFLKYFPALFQQTSEVFPYIVHAGSLKFAFILY